MKNFFLIIILGLAQFGFSQNASDALLLSRSVIDGSARFQSMGGAFTALGGEISSTQVNPAAGAIFLSSKAIFSYGASKINNKSSFYNNGGESENNYNYINQLGGIIVIDNNDSYSPIIKYALGVNYNRTNNFNENIEFSGNNNTDLNVTSGGNLYYKGQSSMSASFALASNGTQPDYLRGGEFLAFDTYLIDINEPDSRYYNPNYPTYTDDDPVYVISAIPENTLQEYKLNRSGVSGKYTFSASMDIDDKIYIGVSYNRSNINTVTKTTLRESEFSSASDLEEFTYNSYINTIGNSNSFSIGAIFRFSDFIRLGLAYHSPDWYKLTDEYDYSLETKFKTPDNNGNYEYSSLSDVNYFDYELTSPSKITSGIALVFNKIGLISIDYEYINYANMKLGPDYDFNYENNDIERTMSSTNNIRIGGEVNMNFISLRGGYTYSDSPFKDKLMESSTQSYSFGAGVNFKLWSLDVAYRNYFKNYNHYIYEANLVNAAIVDKNSSNLVFTLRMAL